MPEGIVEAAPASLYVDELRSRRERLANEMRVRGLDAIVTGTEGNTVYLTGYQTTFWANKSRPFFVVSTPDSRPIIVCHAGEEPSVVLDAVDVDVESYSSPTVVERESRQDIDFHLAGVAKLSEVLKGLGVQSVGLEQGWYFVPTLTFDGYNALRSALDAVRVEDVSEAIWTVRGRKTPWEVERLQKAADVVGAAHASFADNARPGMTERELARLAQECVLSAGADRIAYIGLVADAERAPLGGPTDRTWEPGQLLGVDLCCVVGGYNGDFCRIYAASEATAAQKSAYRALTQALARGRETARPGATVADLSLALLPGQDSAYSRVGHGIGTETTESPSLTVHDRSPLMEGMTVCLEPNEFFDGVGWMVAEETIVVTADGCKLLSPPFPLELPVLDGSMKTSRASTNGAPADSAATNIRQLAQRHLLPAMAQVKSATAEPTVFVRAEGVRLWDSAGNDYLDAMSGMMNVNLGYGREDLALCAQEALRELSFAISFFGYSHASEVELAEQLAEVTPDGVDRFFFTAGGSDANDTAIKLARRHFAARGKPEKTKVIGRMQSYHGMTLAATTLSGDPAYWDTARPLLGGVLHIDQPRFGSDADPNADPAEALMTRIEEEGPETVAAFLAEPVSLPTGAQVPPERYWPRVREICDTHDVLLISDEVITGFGRTGKMFAIDHWRVLPDMLVMAKGITAGYAPLGAVGLTDEIFQSVAQDDRFFAHGFTCGGHPMSCAVARKSLEIMRAQDLVARGDEVGRALQARLEGIQREQGLIHGIRRLGALVAVDCALGPPDLDPLPGENSPGARLTRSLRAQRLIARVYGSTVVMGPAFTMSAEDVDEIADRLRRALADAAP